MGAPRTGALFLLSGSLPASIRHIFRVFFAFSIPKKQNSFTV